ncbi:MAG: adenylate/guanylate cyclase domain-containing protein [Candidatus Meridianibacter frigidus]|nr:MAG: adenylate/guanylate cyclase domain-containing protein [Candidatus Eremiobacteraeota bacterium]
MARPTGTVTFLFSDIEGSTTRWEAKREAMAGALARHDTVMRTEIEKNRGYVFKTIGDEFCAVFERARDAVKAALDAQRQMQAEDFSAVEGMRISMALHTGAADERDGDYFGPAVNRVARLLAIAHGSQVLVSGTAADLLQGEMPPEHSLRDLGTHRLKDLARPEQVYQVVAPDLPEDFPALRSLDALPNNLPRQLTSFVGREKELAEICALIERSRLVTLLGTGGAGKTRCAVQVGAELLDRGGDGVWLVELAPVSDESLVASAIAQTLSVKESPNRPLLETLIAYLARKRLLFILDNCEHLIVAARNIVSAILRSCAEVRILATSREGLSVAGEHVFRMPSLSVPSNGRTLSVRDVLDCDAVALFADRARAADSGFTLTDENAGDVVEICRRLDGIPLAIELAAARVKILTPRQLAQKLDERLRILTSGDRTALPRQQTMRALIDWSYDLLSEPERALFRRLSIFAGGFTWEAAAAVGRDDGGDEVDLLDRLSSLVDKSLLQAELDEERARYRLLESTRQYAREKLQEAGEYATVARAHAASYLELAEQLEKTWGTTSERAWLAQVETEMENWRSALAWALVAQGDIALGWQLAAALRLMWTYLAVAEGRRWTAVALEAVTDATPPALVAKLELTEAHLAGVMLQYKKSYAAAESALARYRALGDAAGITEAELSAGQALVYMGRIGEGKVRLQEALDIAKTLGARRLTAMFTERLAMANGAEGNVDEARALYGESLAIYRATGADAQLSRVATNIAELEFRGGDASVALRYAGETLDADRRANNMLRVAWTLSNMAAYLVALDRFDEAIAHAREALRLSGEMQDSVNIAFALQHLTAAALLRAHAFPTKEYSEAAPAARLLGFVDARIEALGAVREYTEQQEYEKILAALQATLADDLAKVMDEGRTWTEEQAIAEGMAV